MSGLRLWGTGRALPSRLVTNDDMSAIVETSDEWIASRTGIRQRYFCAEGESAETLAVQAAERALADAGVAKEEIGCVVCATSSATYAMPSMACQVHHALGLAQSIPVMDAGAACAGFLYAVEMARCLMLGGAGCYALVIGSEQMSRVLDMTDRSTCVLFGDGAGAAVLALDEQAEYASVFGTTGDMAIRSGGVSHTCMTMDGQAVFRFAVATIPRCVRELLDKTGLTMEQLDWVVCHQANERILARFFCSACHEASHLLLSIRRMSRARISQKREKFQKIIDLRPSSQFCPCLCALCWLQYKRDAAQGPQQC